MLYQGVQNEEKCLSGFQEITTLEIKIFRTLLKKKIQLILFIRNKKIFASLFLISYFT